MAGEVLEGIVTRGHGNRFLVYADGRLYFCQLRKKVKFKTDQTTPVAVGDDVKITVIRNGDGVIEEVLPRRSVLSRPAVGRETSEHVLAANIDSLVVVGSIKSPPLKPGILDRFLIAAQIGNLNPAIVINKIDLGLETPEREAVQVYRELGYNLFLTSGLCGTGLAEFRRYLKQHRSILTGHSGVGKSTILNMLLPGVNLSTREISHASGRGRHATSRIELFHLPEGGFVIDTPGIKVLGFWQLERDRLAGFYPEMRPFLDACRFTHCSHIHEPECAVKDAVARNEISALRYRTYTQIYHSI